MGRARIARRYSRGVPVLVVFAAVSLTALGTAVVSGRAVSGAAMYLLLVALLGAGLGWWWRWQRHGGARTGDSAAPEARFEGAARLFDAAREGMFITDRDNRFVMVNPAYCALLGYPAEELLGRQPRMLQSGRQDDAFYRDLWARLNDQGYWQGEIWNRRRDGEIFPAWMSITAVRESGPGIDHYIGILSDISERKAVLERIEHLAQHDLLTGLPNRALLADRMQLATAQARRSGQRLALLFIDLDRFKVVNDSLGHAVGDKLLRAVADRLAAAIRASDTLSRFGGDEFVVLLPGLDSIEDAARVASKIVEAVCAPFAIDEHELVVGASVGIGIYPDNGTDVDELIALADTAMFAAKHDGGRQYRFYSDAMGEAVRGRMALERDLRGAVARGELFALFQPQQALANGRVVGAEAFVRWQHPERGLLAPASFIPVAEESGLSVEIGDWMLEATCRQAEAWRAQGLFRGTLSVNVSAMQFLHAGFVDTVRRVLAETGLPPEQLAIELTEQTVMQPIEALKTRLEELAAIGVRLVVDDFGTGYSNVSHLCRLPASRLKIDESIVRELPADTHAVAVAAAIVSLGHALAIGVIAESVETAEQARCLHELQCDEGQGYFYAQPLTAAHFAEWLRAHAARAERGDPGPARTA